MKVTVIPIVIGALATVPIGLVTWTGGLGNKKKSGDHPNYSFVEISKNTEKSPGDLRRIAVTQTSVKNHPLTLMLKTLKRVVIFSAFYLDVSQGHMNGAFNETRTHLWFTHHYITQGALKTSQKSIIIIILLLLVQSRKDY